MNIYERLGVPTIINASETYTKLGGSLMEEETLKAMVEAACSFMEYDDLMDAVQEKAAQLTRNDAAFVTTGAAAGLILSIASLMIMSGGIDGESEDELLGVCPHADRFLKNEILIFDGPFLEGIPYWRLADNTGVKIVKVKPNPDALKAAVNDKTVGMMLFPAPLYEREIMTCEEAIPLLKELGIRIIVDAAAQLPPASNLWYYTKILGADICVFSGGKHIKGPQSTGLMVGDSEIIRISRRITSPNAYIGRGFKTGKEELAGFITALDIFVNTSEEERFNRQQSMLDTMERMIKSEYPEIETKMLTKGRLGTNQPLLLVYLPGGLKAEDCNKFTRSLDTQIDIGTYTPEFNMPENLIFLNAYNLKDGEEIKTAEGVIGYIRHTKK